MSEGISRATAQQIAESVVRPVQQGVNQLERRIEQIEEEMAKLASAITAMTDKLSRKLDEIKTSTDKVESTTNKGFGETTDKLAAMHVTDIAGYAAVRDGVDSVESAVEVVGRRVGTLDTTMQRLTNATIQLDLERALAEVQGPLALFKAFETEINERHQMAQQSANSIYQQYMQLHSKVNESYAGKLRTIGEHIYAIYEGDFLPYAQRPLSEDPGELTDLVREIEGKVIASRSSALDREFSQFVSGALEPMLGALSALRHDIGERFDHDDIDTTDGPRAIGVPVLAVEDAARAAWDLLVDAEVEAKSPNDSARATLSLNTPKRLKAWQGELAKSWDDRVESGRVHAADKDTLERVKRELAALAAEGLVPSDLVPDLQAYVDTFGIEIIALGGGAKA